MGYIEERIGVLEAKIASLEAFKLRVGRSAARAATAIEPTWTSSRGETFRLCDLPTPYLANIHRFATRMVTVSFGGTGLVDAIRRELATRTDR